MTDRAAVAALASETNRSPGQWQMRGLKAEECDEFGTLLRAMRSRSSSSGPADLDVSDFCCDDGLGHSDGLGGPASCAPHCACPRCLGDRLEHDAVQPALF